MRLRDDRDEGWQRICAPGDCRGLYHYTDRKEVTFDKLVQGILDEYDVEEQVAREDIREFLDKLIAGGILKADHEDRDNEQDT